jgi:hypothetical protein
MKFVKIANPLLIGGAEALAAGAAEAGAAGLAEGALSASQVKALQDAFGNKSKGFGEELVDEALEQSKKSQYKEFENTADVVRKVSLLKDEYLREGVPQAKFDSFFPSQFDIKDPASMAKMSKDTRIDQTIELLEMFLNVTGSTYLEKILDLGMIIWQRNHNIQQVKLVVESAAQLENELLGLGIIEFITKCARSRNTSGKEFFALMIGDPKLQVKFSRALAHAVGHGQASAEQIVSTTQKAMDATKRSLQELGLSRGLQQGLEAPKFLEAERNLYEFTEKTFKNFAPITGLVRSIFYTLNIGYSLSEQATVEFVPGKAQRAQAPFSPGITVSNSSYKFVKVANIRTAGSMDPRILKNELDQKLDEALKSSPALRLNPFFMNNASKGINTLISLNNASIAGNAAEVSRLTGDLRNYAGSLGSAPNLQKALNTGLDFVTTGSAASLADLSATTQETAEAVFGATTFIKEIAPSQQKFDRAVKNYQTAKSAYYGTGSDNAGMIKTIVKELGEDKQVAYNSAEQVKGKISNFIASIDSAIAEGDTLLKIYARVMSNPAAMSNLSGDRQVAAAQIEQFKVQLQQIQIKLENIKKEKLEVEREGATIEQSMKQRDIRFFGGSQTATDAELIQKTLGGPFAVGHVMELNKLNEPLIQEQKQKIQNLQAMEAAAVGERKTALQADIVQEKGKLSQLESKGLLNLQDALSGSFSKDFYTKAIESPGAAFAKVTSKFVKIAGFKKLEDDEAANYWDELLPGEGTALKESPEHAGDTIQQILDVHPELKKKSSFKLI